VWRCAGDVWRIRPHSGDQNHAGSSSRFLRWQRMRLRDLWTRSCVVAGFFDCGRYASLMFRSVDMWRRRWLWSACRAMQGLIRNSARSGKLPWFATLGFAASSQDPKPRHQRARTPPRSADYEARSGVSWRRSLFAGQIPCYVVVGHAVDQSRSEGRLRAGRCAAGGRRAAARQRIRRSGYAGSRCSWSAVRIQRPPDEARRG